MSSTPSRTGWTRWQPSRVFKGQALASLGSLIGLLDADPFLTRFTADLAAAQGALAAAGSATDTFTVSVNLPAGVTATFEQTEGAAQSDAAEAVRSVRGGRHTPPFAASRWNDVVFHGPA